MANTSYQRRMAKGNYYYYLNSRYTDLNSAYGSVSSAKREAWDYCLRLMNDNDGSGSRVISKNTWKFSAGFTYTDKETGKEMFMYITSGYDCAVAVKECED